MIEDWRGHVCVGRLDLAAVPSPCSRAERQPASCTRRSGSHSRRMGTRHLHEGGFRPCSRCGRRTFWLCEDCGR